MSLKNKIALVTGASSGIGKELSKLISKHGYHVILIGRNLNKLNKTYDEIKKINGSSTIVNLDLKDFVGIDRLGLEVFNKFGKIDLIILNASILGTLGPLTHQEPNEFEEVLNVNLISNYRLLRSLEPLLKKSEKPNIVFICSNKSKDNSPYWGAYSIAKAGLEQMANLMFSENSKKNILVTKIIPNPTDTKLNSQAFPGVDKFSLLTPSESAKQILLKLKNKI